MLPPRVRSVNNDTFYLLDVALFMPNITEISLFSRPLCNLDIPEKHFNLFSFSFRKVKWKKRETFVIILLLTKKVRNSLWWGEESG